jgi:hypothetical protein
LAVVGEVGDLVGVGYVFALDQIPVLGSANREFKLGMYPPPPPSSPHTHRALPPRDHCRHDASTLYLTNYSSATLQVIFTNVH